MANKHGGKRSNAGRKPGSKTMINVEFKEAVLRAFDKLGGEKYLVTVGKDKPEVFFKLLAKILPNAVEGDINVHKVSLIDLTGEDVTDAD